MKAFVKVRPEPIGVEYLDRDVPSMGVRDIVIHVKAIGIYGIYGTDNYL